MRLVRSPNQMQKTRSGKVSPYPPRYRRPFWLPASNYYVLTLAVTIAFFVLIWGLLHDGEDEASWIVAAIGASGVLVGAVFLREVILRKARRRYLLAQKQLDYNLNNVALHHARVNRNPNKLTIEKNAAILREIEKKSEAARVLGKLSEGHLEVFEMCNEYLELNEKELETVGIGSPRLAALRRGKEIVQELHHFHLLQWAESESKALTQEAKIRVTMSEKLETAQKALSVVESALEFYPVETKLIESGNALKEFVASIKVSHWVEQAERAAFKGNYKRAISLYRDALFFLARGEIGIEEKEIIAAKINAEIARLREVTEKKGKNKGNLEE